MDRIKMLLVTLLLLLTGCEDPPETGIITEKTHRGAYTSVQQVCAAYGNNGICTVYVPVIHHVPESWGLCLRNRDKVGCREVPRETWDRYQVGGTYP